MLAGASTKVVTVQDQRTSSTGTKSTTEHKLITAGSVAFMTALLGKGFSEVNHPTEAAACIAAILTSYIFSGIAVLSAPTTN